MLSKFEEVVSQRHDIARGYKERGGRLVGYFCDYTPEEVIHAAGMIPIRITGTKDQIVKADRYLQVNVCSFARSCLELALGGTYDYLDGLVVTHTCDVITKMYELWQYRLEKPDFLHYVWFPHNIYDDGALSVVEEEIRRLKRSLEDFVGSEISDEALDHSIEVYNTNRRLLKEIYEWRRTDPPKLSGTEAFAITLSGLLMPKEEHNLLLEELLRNIGGAEDGHKRNTRLMVAASMLDDLDLIKLIEERGGNVVCDDLCTGSRYFWDLVQVSDSPPITRLAERYLRKVPCPRSCRSERPRFAHIKAMIEDYRAHGVILYILRCCDAHLYQYPKLQKELDVPLLYIQGEQSLSGLAQIRNRVDAFLEMLEGA
jgi:benzoyl-CoA reductase subunit C